MLCKNYVNFFVAFFMLETSLAQSVRLALLELTEANFNHTIAFYEVVFVTFLSRDSSTFWKAYHYRKNEIEKRFVDNLYATIGAVECLEEESICKRYNIKHYPTFKVIISGKEYDTLVGPVTSENMLKFIDKYLDDDHDLVPINSGDSDWDDFEEEQIVVDRYFRINLPDFDLDGNSTESSSEVFSTDSTTDSSGEISVTEELDLVSSTSDETLGRSSNPEFSFEGNVTEEIDSGEYSTETSTSFSKANSINRTADLITFLLLLYNFYS